MTTSDYRKVFKQLKAKPVKLQKYLKFNKPKERKYGKSLRRCRKCGRTGGIISKYGLLYCRQCFREEAKKLGFAKR